MNSEEMAATLMNDSCISPIFRGVYPVDLLPAERRGVYVVNTSPARVSTGHWVAIIGDELFCSYGIEPSVYGIQGVRSVAQRRLQAIDSKICGLYVIAYVAIRCRGYSTRDFYNCFTLHDTVNDDIMMNVFNMQ